MWRCAEFIGWAIVQGCPMNVWNKKINKEWVPHVVWNISFFSWWLIHGFSCFFRRAQWPSLNICSKVPRPSCPPPHIVLIHRSLSEWELCGPTASPHLSVQTLSVLARGIKRSAEPRLCHGNLWTRSRILPKTIDHKLRKILLLAVSASRFRRRVSIGGKICTIINF